MKGLIKWLLILCVVVALFVFAINGFDQAARNREAREREEIRLEREAEQRREARIQAAMQVQPAPQTAHDSEMEYNNQAEYELRQIAERNDVEVLEYRPIAWREVFMHLRTRNQVGFGEMLDEAIFEDIIWDFDDEMMRNNTRMMLDPNGARIWDARFTIKIEMQ